MLNLFKGLETEPLALRNLSPLKKFRFLYQISMSTVLKPEKRDTALVTLFALPFPDKAESKTSPKRKKSFEERKGVRGKERKLFFRKVPLLPPGAVNPCLRCPASQSAAPAAGRRDRCTGAARGRPRSHRRPRPCGRGPHPAPRGWGPSARRDDTRRRAAR